MSKNATADTVEAIRSDIRPGPPCVLVVFGLTGDLGHRKIAPALYNLAREGLITERTAVLAAGRREFSDGELRRTLRDAVSEHSRAPVDRTTWDAFAGRLHYAVCDGAKIEQVRDLGERIDEINDQHDAGGNRLFYLATAPGVFDDTAEHLGAGGLNRPGAGGSFSRLLVEKPFGRDAESARRLNELMSRRFGEENVFRIDHYLGKEMVQNLLVMRFANAVFEPLFNNRYVDHVQITTSETAGMEGRRGSYYEQAGALRDMVQSHMLQLLALTAMDMPSCIRCEEVRDRKAEVLRAIVPPSADDVPHCTVRGQYGPSGEAPGYRQEEGVDSGSRTETFAALRLGLSNERWSGVPFYLRTGKRLAAKASQIVIEFKREPMGPFRQIDCDLRGPNRLVARVYPDEGATLIVDAKVPGVRPLLRPVKMDFRYGSSFDSASPEAYEHLLLDAMCGDATSFLRRDEVEAAWRPVDVIRRVWDERDEPALLEYAPGTWGPERADALFGDPYKHWRTP